MSHQEDTENDPWDVAVREARAARDEAYRALGELDEGISIVMPLSTPPWPTRPTWRTLYRPGRTAFVTDGLSDPTEEGEAMGFGLELLLETSREQAPELAVPEDACDSWAFQMLARVSSAIAGTPFLRTELLKLGHAIVTLPADVDCPPGFVSDSERVGLLVHAAGGDLPEHLSLPGGAPRLFVVTVLFPEEWESAGRSAEAAPSLVRALAGSPTRHLSVPDREPVLATTDGPGPEEARGPSEDDPHPLGAKRFEAGAGAFPFVAIVGLVLASLAAALGFALADSLLETRDGRVILGCSFLLGFLLVVALFHWAGANRQPALVVRARGFSWLGEDVPFDDVSSVHYVDSSLSLLAIERRSGTRIEMPMHLRGISRTTARKLLRLISQGQPAATVRRGGLPSPA